MEILTGRPVSPGYATGRAVVHAGEEAVEIPRYQIDQADIDGELERFHQALERSRDELRQLERRVLAELGDSYSSIFSAHLLLLHDRQFTEGVRERVRGDLINVEQALDEQVADLTHTLESLENEAHPGFNTTVRFVRKSFYGMTCPRRSGGLRGEVRDDRGSDRKFGA